MPSSRKNSGVAPVGADTQRIDPQNLIGIRIVDQRLGFSTPAEHIPHRRRCREHGRRRIHCITALLKHHCPGGGTLRFTGHRNPMLAQQDGTMGLDLGGSRGKKASARSERRRLR